MPEITRKRTGELLRGVFKILLSDSEAQPAREVLSKMETIVPPSEFENSSYPSNPEVRRYERIIRFSTIAPVKAGWMTKGKGIWAITEEGRRAYEKFKDPEQFMREAVRLFKEWSDKQIGRAHV